MISRSLISSGINASNPISFSINVVRKTGSLCGVFLSLYLAARVIISIKQRLSDELCEKSTRITRLITVNTRKA